jgi:hypothetical protein
MANGGRMSAMTFQVQIRIDIAPSDANERRIKAMGDWIDKLLSNRNTKKEDQQREGDLARVAVSYAPEMFRKLCARIQSDVFRFATATNQKIITKMADVSTLDVLSSDYPVFTMRLTFEQTRVSVERTIRQNPSSDDTSDSAVIYFVAKSHDQVYYRVGGEDIASESVISERLLRPLLERP